MADNSDCNEMMFKFPCFKIMVLLIPIIFFQTYVFADKCVSCGYENKEQLSYCLMCGTDIEIIEAGKSLNEIVRLHVIRDIRKPKEEWLDYVTVGAGKTYYGLINDRKENEMEIISFFYDDLSGSIIGSETINIFYDDIVDFKSNLKDSDKDFYRNLIRPTFDFITYIDKNVSFANGKESTHVILSGDIEGIFAKEILFLLETLIKGFHLFFNVKEKSGIERLKIEFIQTNSDYSKISQSSVGYALVNPAFYIPKTNEAFVLNPYSIIKEVQDNYFNELKCNIKELKEKCLKEKNNPYKTQILKILDDAKLEVLQKENILGHLLNEYKKAIFKIIFHETFHYYLKEYLLKGKEGVQKCPLWLNEGMAQFFENAEVVNGHFLIGNLNSEVIDILFEDFDRTGGMDLEMLLKAQSDLFAIQSHNLCDINESNRYFVYSWALVYYLSGIRSSDYNGFLSRYLDVYNKGVDQITAFKEVIQAPISDFERNWKSYIKDVIIKKKYNNL